MTIIKAIRELIDLHRETLSQLKTLKATAPTRDTVLTVSETASQLGLSSRPCEVWLRENGLLISLGLPEICDRRKRDSKVVVWGAVLDVLAEKAPTRPQLVPAKRPRPAIRRGALHGARRRG